MVSSLDEISLVISNFPEDISSLPLLLFSSIFMHCSLKNALPLLAILWNSAFNWTYLSLSPLFFTCFLIGSSLLFN